ncbi:MAG: sugar ABC transporter ATP-binding protein [Lachnospiraceae bacterium]
MENALSILNAKGIEKWFGGVQALKGVDLEVMPSEIHCLCGENGCGKSTLIKVISGVHSADAGTIVLNGNEYTKLNVRQAINEGVQVIYQDLSLFARMTVAENIAINKMVGSDKKLISWNEINKIASEQLERIGVSMNLKSTVEENSISNRQLVAICRALSMDAKILFLDEPTTALTHSEVDRLLEIVMNLKKSGMSIVFVSHKLDEVMQVADKVTVLRDGILSGHLNSEELGNIEQAEKKLIYFMTGKNVNYARYYNPIEGGKTLLSVNNLTRSPQYKNLTMEVKEGEIVGVTGLLGSGRTEFALSLFGLNQPDSGEVVIGDKSGIPKSPREAISRGLVLVPEERQTQGVYMNRSIEDNISSVSLKKVSSRFGVLKTKDVKKIADETINSWRVKAPGRDTTVSQLSGGNQQKVALGRWAQISPRVMIFDSPTVGVDIGSKSEIYEKIQSIASSGVGVILISDDIPELLANSTRILVFNSGQITKEMNREEIESKDARHLIEDSISKGFMKEA